MPVRKCTSFFYALMWLISGPVIAQDISQQEYYVGTAEGTDLESVRASALNDLSSKIQLFLTSSSYRRIDETNSGLTDSTSIQVITKSALNLTGVEEIPPVKLGKNRFRVTKYVSKENVRKLFERRKMKILEHLDNAENYLASAQNGIHLGRMLKHFGAAFLLSKMYPDTITFTYAGLSSHTRVTRHPDVYITSRLNEIVTNVTFLPLKKAFEDKVDKYAEWLCGVSWKGQKVIDLDYEYFDGSGRSIGQVKNGETKITLYFTDSLKDITVNARPEFFYEEETDEELAAASALLNVRPPDPEISFVIPLKSNQQKAAAEASHPPTEKKEPVTEPAKPARQPVAVTEESSPAPGKLPKPIVKLITSNLDGEGVIKLLALLEKENRLVKGRADMFESLEGLYGIIIDKQGIAALFQYKNGKYTDPRTGEEVKLEKFENKRLTWVEALE